MSVCVSVRAVSDVVEDDNGEDAPLTVLEQLTREHQVHTPTPLEHVDFPAYPRVIDQGHALTRGVANLLTGWLEIPREMFLENIKYPFFGVITGAMRGSFFTTARTVLSVTDIAMLGFTGPSLYDPVFFPEYVWEARWNPYRPLTQEEKLLEKRFHDIHVYEEHMDHAL